VSAPLVLTDALLEQACAELAARDPDLAGVLARYGLPPMWAREPGFATLLYIILEQQVSLASARAAFVRLKAALDPLTPESFLTLDDAQLKTIGFSRQKTRYGRILAQAVLSGSLDLDALPRLPDEQVRSELIKLTGIGEWSVGIYQLMALLRADIFPRGDIALAAAMREVKRLPALPNNEEMQAIAAAWSPWRAVAARLL
jgi:DNA-3-methyladenine glycosylase II